MPIVRVDLWAGRTQDCKRKLAKEITEVIAENVECSKQAVIVLFNDVPHDSWASGGELVTDLLKDKIK